MYDNLAFDRETLPLRELEQMLRRLFAKPRKTIYQAGSDQNVVRV